MKINKKNVILGLEWLSFQCGEYMGDLQKDRCEISDIPQEYIDLFKDIDTGDSDTDELLEDEQMAQDGKISCSKCGKFTDERQMSLGTTGGKDWAICWRCESDQGYRICCRDYSCDECGGDGFIEYDNSSKKEGEVIESYDKEECNKCNGKGTI